jgi:hypothetical protein
VGLGQEKKKVIGLMGGNENGRMKNTRQTRKETKNTKTKEKQRHPAATLTTKEKSWLFFHVVIAEKICWKRAQRAAYADNSVIISYVTGSS